MLILQVGFTIFRLCVLCRGIFILGWCLYPSFNGSEFCRSRNYGVLRNTSFLTTTSSPLLHFFWLLLIKIFGNWEYISFGLQAIIAGVALILVFNKYLKPFSVITRFVFLVALVVLMPLHLMIMTGMELMFSLALIGFSSFSFRKISGG